MIRRLRRLIIRLWLFISWKCCNVTWLWQVESWHYQWQVTQWEQQCHIEWPDQDTGHGDTGTGYKEIVNMIAYLSSSKVIVGLKHHFFYFRYVVSDSWQWQVRCVTASVWHRSQSRVARSGRCEPDTGGDSRYSVVMDWCHAATGSEWSFARLKFWCLRQIDCARSRSWGLCCWSDKYLKYLISQFPEKLNLLFLLKSHDHSIQSELETNLARPYTKYDHEKRNLPEKIQLLTLFC